jgi:hypothetical protein
LHGGSDPARMASTELSTLSWTLAVRSGRISTASWKVGGAILYRRWPWYPGGRTSPLVWRACTDPTREVQGRVVDEVGQGEAVGGGHQLDSPGRDGTCDLRLLGGADLVDDDDLRGVVLDGLQEDFVLAGRVGHLHAPCAADGGVGHVPVPADLVAGVHHDHPEAELVRQDAGSVAQDGGLAGPRGPQEEQRPAGGQEVAQRRGRAREMPAHPHGEPGDVPVPVADGGDAVQGAGDSGPVVRPELPDFAHHVLQVSGGDRVLQEHVASSPPELRGPSEVQDDLHEFVEVGTLHQGADVLGEVLQEALEVSRNARSKA